MTTNTVYGISGTYPGFVYSARLQIRPMWSNCKNQTILQAWALMEPYVTVKRPVCNKIISDQHCQQTSLFTFCRLNCNVARCRLPRNTLLTVHYNCNVVHCRGPLSPPVFASDSWPAARPDRPRGPPLAFGLNPEIWISFLGFPRFGQGAEGQEQDTTGRQAILPFMVSNSLKPVVLPSSVCSSSLRPSVHSSVRPENSPFVTIKIYKPILKGIDWPLRISDIDIAFKSDFWLTLEIDEKVYRRNDSFLSAVTFYFLWKMKEMYKFK